ncbi:MAG: Gfo/Idh/MocA family oxidoreductase [Planctomycetes bacterium]|nr:Gfo/Idh/MocA family oxidoreductase [Planctomycetota bacterium]
MPPVSRRTFLSRTGKMAAGAAVAGFAYSAARAESAPAASERVNVALLGCGGRGRYVMRGVAEQGARITMLCDLQQNRMDETAKFLSEVQQDKPALVKDMRRVFDSKEVDAVIVATPDRWHAPASIRACQAGKDVYVEKPHSYNIWESGKMIEAARKHNRVLQVGTQNRSGPYAIAARDYVRSGKLGKICLVRVFNMKSGGPFRLGDPGKQPEGFDWDAWLGSAPLRPYHQHIVHGGWHNFWDFCGGDMADDGIHQVDLALMVMGDPPLPRSVRSLGGRYAHRGDDSECPDVLMVNWDFGNFVMTFEMTGYPRYMEKTSTTIRRNDLFPYWTMNATRIELYGSELLMTLGRHGGGWIVQQSGGGIVDQMYGRPCDEPHYANFLECIKTRKNPNADIAVARAGNVLVHMGNIAHRIGNVALKYDPEANRFDNPEANKFIKTPYRKGYEIPEEV